MYILRRERNIVFKLNDETSIKKQLRSSYNQPMLCIQSVYVKMSSVSKGHRVSMYIAWV